MDGIQIFYDGTNISKYSSLNYVTGVTTNTSFMKQAGVTDYSSFFNGVRDVIAGRPISMQVFDDDPREQARKIASYGNNVWAKIPIVDANGNSNLPVIRELLQEGVKVNITAVFSDKQCSEICKYVNEVDTPAIVSIFAGRISDTGKDPVPIISRAVELYKDMKNVQVLWAGCKDVLSIRKARDIGCHIITVPGDILDRIGRLDKDLDEFSLETVRGFKKDSEFLNV
jgi:transaldolase